jgi:hypothetical protein
VDIKTKFDIGQKVYLVRIKKDYITCPACNGSGKLLGLDGKKYGCLRCFGHGDIYSDGKFEGVDEMITSIVIEKFNRVFYHCSCTYSVPEDEIYSTKKEADEVAREANTPSKSKKSKVCKKKN